MRPIQHRHLLQRDALLAQLQHPLRHEAGLRPRIVQRHQGGFHTAADARGMQILLEAPRVRADRRIREVEDFRHAAVVRLDGENLAAFIAVGKSQDVLHVRAAPRVDRLRVIAHRHQAVRGTDKQVDHAALHGIRILIFIHQDVFESLLIELQHIRPLLEEPHGEHQQVIEIHGICIQLFRDVTDPHRLDLLQPVIEMVIPRGDDILQRRTGVFDEAEDRGQHIGLGKAALLGIDVAAGDHRVQERLLVVAVENRERPGKAQIFRVPPQDPAADRVEGPRPQVRGIVRHQIADPLDHFTRRFIREGQQQHLLRVQPVVQQPGHPVSQRPRFPRPRPRDDKRLPRRRGNGFVLLRIQSRHVIDAGSRRDRGTMKGVLAGHGRRDRGTRFPAGQPVCAPLPPMSGGLRSAAAPEPQMNRAEHSFHLLPSGTAALRPLYGGLWPVDEKP